MASLYSYRVCGYDLNDLDPNVELGQVTSYILEAYVVMAYV